MKNKLSDRENRVLNMLLKGFEEIEIAEQMELTAKTIKSDIERIQDKWEVSSVAGVIVEACVRG